MKIYTQEEVQEKKRKNREFWLEKYNRFIDAAEEDLEKSCKGNYEKDGVDANLDWLMQVTNFYFSNSYPLSLLIQLRRGKDFYKQENKEQIIKLINLAEPVYKKFFELANDLEVALKEARQKSFIIRNSE